MTRKSVLFTTLYSVKHDTKYVWVGSSTDLDEPQRQDPHCPLSTDIISMARARAIRAIKRGPAPAYSINSSTVASNDGGIANSRAFAVLALIANLKCVGCSTGSWAGFAPFRILST